MIAGEIFARNGVDLRCSNNTDKKSRRKALELI